MDTSASASLQTPPSTPKSKHGCRSTRFSPYSKRSKASCLARTVPNNENAGSPVPPTSAISDAKLMLQQTAGKLVFSGLRPNKLTKYANSRRALDTQTSRNIAYHNSSLPNGATSRWTSLSAEQRDALVAERHEWNALPENRQEELVRASESKHSLKLRNFG